MTKSGSNQALKSQQRYGNTPQSPNDHDLNSSDKYKLDINISPIMQEPEAEDRTANLDEHNEYTGKDKEDYEYIKGVIIKQL